MSKIDFSILARQGYLYTPKPRILIDWIAFSGDSALYTIVLTRDDLHRLIGLKVSQPVIHLLSE